MDNRFDILSIIMIVFIIGFSLKIYFDSDMYNLKCILSDEDGNTYCVRERPKLKLVANLLAKITNKLQRVVDYLYEKYPDRENCKRLHKNFNPTKITEILPTSKYTAYSENKGEKIAFCVTTEKTNDRLIDENTLTFVALHELSHIATESIGHTDEFWNNFKFILETAVKLNLYTPVDYKKKPIKYCSMNINDNPYYDM